MDSSDYLDPNFLDDSFDDEESVNIDPSLGNLDSASKSVVTPTYPTYDDLNDYDEFEPLIFSDDDDQFFLENEGDDGKFDLREHLRAASGFRLRKKPTSKNYGRRQALRMANKELKPEVRDNFAKANEAFVKQDFDTAIKYYLEVIRLDRRNFGAYKTMGEIYQMKGDMNKCCGMWLYAALCVPWDIEFWGTVAELSTQLGHIDQAIYCYNHAINYRPKDTLPNPQFLLDRAMLHRQKRLFGRALEGFQRLHRMFPTDPQYVKHLASVYCEQKRLSDAVRLYKNILEDNINAKPDQKYVPFDWSALNILCELLITQHNWKEGVKMIKAAARFLQDRGDESWWTDEDDSEFDERRPSVILKFHPHELQKYMGREYGLPIDIRFKLAQFRLELDNSEEALRHFEFLYHEEDLFDVADLFFEAGKLLEEKGLQEDALKFLAQLIQRNGSAAEDEDQTEEFRSEAMVLMGKCYMELYDYENAKEVFTHVLQNEPNNIDLQLMLCETYFHLNDFDKANQFLESIKEAQEIEEETPEEKELNIEIDKQVGLEEGPAVIKNTGQSKRTHKLTQAEREDINRDVTHRITNKFNRMKRLQQAINEGNMVAAAAWMKLAAQLIETFCAVRSFFPKNRKTAFKGIPTYKRKEDVEISDRVRRLDTMMENKEEGENYSRMELTNKTEFRGLSYDDWLLIFVQNAFLWNNYKHDTDQAIASLGKAFEVNVFIQDKTRSMLLRLAMLSFGILKEDFGEIVSNNVRYFLTSTQFSSTIYDFFMCCFSSGVGAWAAFSNYNHQKYFLRHLKAYDSLLTSSSVSGSAQVTLDTANFTFTREHPQLLYIYACLLGSNRTFSSPIVYLTRAYREYNKDSTICFMLGLAHVHRSMQRNSNNRHIQLLQGISYLLEYKECREQNSTIYELQEIEYNFGRLFHMLGLPTLAIKHYKKVLQFHDEMKDDTTYDMLPEAAYNLNLIYILDGNTAMARDISEKYLTV